MGFPPTLPAWLLLFALTAAPGDVQLRLSREGDPKATFEAVGLDPQLLATLAAEPARGAEVLRVTTGGGNGDDRPALLGSYSAENGVLRFRPRFPLEPGMRYRATLRRPGSDAVVSAEFRPMAPVPSTPTTSVARVSPSGDTLPENLLKFYVEFTAPMGRGEAYEHVHLLRDGERPVPGAFLELGEELWDPSGTRLTLLFDPGRIKSGLKPREEAGPVLESGRSYTLVIDRNWRDAAGNRLTADFRKTFRAGPADMTPPDPLAWRIEPPKAGSTGPLVVRFPEPLDRALLRRLLSVADGEGRRVAGRVAVEIGERAWSFTPERAWSPGRFALVADRDLEDLAGNSIGRPFEVDVFRKVEARPAVETVTVPFTVVVEERHQTKGSP